MNSGDLDESSCEHCRHVEPAKVESPKVDPIGVTGDWAWTALAALIGIGAMLVILQVAQAAELVDSLAFFAVLTAAAGAILRASVHNGADVLSKRTDHAGKLFTVAGLSGGITGAASKLDTFGWAVPVYGVLLGSLVVGIVIEYRRSKAQKLASSGVSPAHRSRSAIEVISPGEREGITPR